MMDVPVPEKDSAGDRRCAIRRFSFSFNLTSFDDGRWGVDINHDPKSAAVVDSFNEAMNYMVKFVGRRSAEK